MVEGAAAVELEEEGERCKAAGDEERGEGIWADERVD
jgi:hypothetical protein